MHSELASDLQPLALDLKRKWKYSNRQQTLLVTGTKGRDSFSSSYPQWPLYTYVTVFHRPRKSMVEVETKYPQSRILWLICYFTKLKSPLKRLRSILCKTKKISCSLRKFQIVSQLHATQQSSPLRLNHKQECITRRPAQGSRQTGRLC